MERFFSWQNLERRIRNEEGSDGADCLRGWVSVVGGYFNCNDDYGLLARLRLVRALRVLKLLRVVRLVGLTGRLTRFFKTNGLLYYIYISFATLVVAAAMYCISEKVSFATALWWSITTATTVGYGDISPTTLLGRLAAILLMIVGIGFVGMLTSAITNFFVQEHEENGLAVELERLHSENEELKTELKTIKALLVSLQTQQK